MSSAVGSRAETDAPTKYKICFVDGRWPEDIPRYRNLERIPVINEGQLRAAITRLKDDAEIQDAGECVFVTRLISETRALRRAAEALGLVVHKVPSRHRGSD